MTSVAFIGLGNMGSGMCANLARAGYDVRAFDLNPEAIGKVEAAGARSAGSLREAATGADIVISMLPAGKHVLEVYFGAEGASRSANSGALFIDCSTIAVEESREAAKLAEAAGFLMIDAPVSGGTAAAEKGTLTFMVGGAGEAFEAGKPLLAKMGKNILYAGGAGNGQAAKIANNMLLGICMIGTCEAFALAEKLGLDAQTFFNISSVSSGQNWSMTSYCPAPGLLLSAPSNWEYKPGFAVAMMLKDLTLARVAAGTVHANIPLGLQAEEIYAVLSDEGYSGLDFSGVMKWIKGEI